MCKALWGQLRELEASLDETNQYVERLQRRKAFSHWLAETAVDRIESEVVMHQKERPIEAVFSYLTGCRISEACRLAQRSGERLACVWQSSDKKSINVCSQLDWKRALAVHLWYMLPPTASIAQALQKYEEAFQVSDEGQCYASYPLPSYLENADLAMESETFPPSMQRDVCFHLLKLYSDRSYDLRQLLDPRSITSDPLDYRLSWHLWMVLQALNYTHLSAQSQGVLHASYAAQLENVGLWEWAVFVILHIPDPV
ncbi:hypothetical protein AB205_0076280 [Aquarana catesbeiana]|uniref:Nuclear pore complex protein NUP96 C-terminal domain-containing protein n=1 Tax=Aquarana catesbeiana TaxID=8400 RepID=A0A2G9R9Y0_AQUCT|nr:hypothetical protein AB205_0076280 [Aquarana catesbeiana]